MKNSCMSSPSRFLEELHWYYGVFGINKIFIFTVQNDEILLEVSMYLSGVLLHVAVIISVVKKIKIICGDRFTWYVLSSDPPALVAKLPDTWNCSLALHSVTSINAEGRDLENMTWVSLAYMLKVGALERTWVIQFNLVLPRSLRLCVHSGPRAIGMLSFH